MKKEMQLRMSKSKLLEVTTLLNRSDIINHVSLFSLNAPKSGYKITRAVKSQRNKGLNGNTKKTTTIRQGKRTHKNTKIINDIVT